MRVKVQKEPSSNKVAVPSRGVSLPVEDRRSSSSGYGGMVRENARSHQTSGFGEQLSNSPRSVAQRVQIQQSAESIVPRHGDSDVRGRTELRCDDPSPIQAKGGAKEKGKTNQGSGSEQSDNRTPLLDGERREEIAPSTESETYIPTESDKKDAWTIAQHQTNLPFDSGAFVGGIVRNSYLKRYKDAAKHVTMERLSAEKAAIIKQNMYGSDGLGQVMQKIDTASRIMHLIGSVSGIIALVLNLIGFGVPACLPIGAIAGMVSLAAHTVMTVLQGILIRHNVKRMRALPDEDKARIRPTLYRDCAKLGYGLLGVITGGISTGLTAASGGGVLASQALSGADKGRHIGAVVSDTIGEFGGTGAMVSTIAHQNSKEAQLGYANNLGSTLQFFNDGELGDHMMVEIQRSESFNSSIERGADEASHAISSMEAGGKDLRALSGHRGQLEAGVQTLDRSESLDSQLEASQSALDKEEAEVAKAETALNIPSSGGSELAPEAGRSMTQDPVQEMSMYKGQGSSTQSTTAQRAENNKPGLFDRAKGWLARKFLNVKKRTQRVIQGVKAKLNTVILHLAGIKDLPREMHEVVGETRSSAKHIEGASKVGRTELEKWRSAVDQMKKLKK